MTNLEEMRNKALPNKLYHSRNLNQCDLDSLKLSLEDLKPHIWGLDGLGGSLAKIERGKLIKLLDELYIVILRKRRNEQRSDFIQRAESFCSLLEKSGLLEDKDISKEELRVFDTSAGFEFWGENGLGATPAKKRAIKVKTYLMNIEQYLPLRKGRESVIAFNKRVEDFHNLIKDSGFRTISQIRFEAEIKKRDPNYEPYCIRLPRKSTERVNGECEDKANVNYNPVRFYDFIYDDNVFRPERVEPMDKWVNFVEFRKLVKRVYRKIVNFNNGNKVHICLDTGFIIYQWNVTKIHNGKLTYSIPMSCKKVHPYDIFYIIESFRGQLINVLEGRNPTINIDSAKDDIQRSIDFLNDLEKDALLYCREHKLDATVIDVTDKLLEYLTYINRFVVVR